MNSKRPNTSIIAYNCIFRNLSKKNPLWRPATEKVYFYEEIEDDNGGKGDGEFMDIEDRISGKPVYDTENGYPIEQTIYEYDYELMEDYPALRYTSEGYFDASAGIDDVTVDTDAPVEYFNLQGIRVANPSAGNIHIRRQGAKTDKVLVK